MENQGVILGQRNTDYVSGRIGASLPYEVRVPDGNWEQYLPVGEIQRNSNTDLMACVSFSALNAIETQLRFFGDERNLSDRFTAMMSGTTKQGNYLFRVVDSIRHDGVVLEEEYPAPENYNWDTYYTAPPIEIINRAKEFLGEYEVKYEWILNTKESMLHHIKHAPIQIVIFNHTHAVMSFYREEDIIHYFDSYDPFIKKVRDISTPLKIVLNKKKKKMKLIIKGTEQYLRGADGKDRHVYNEATLLDHIAAGEVENTIPEPVDEINPIGRAWVSLQQE